MVKVFRANVSPYQASDFITKEQQALQSIESVEYTKDLNDCDILLTNTHTKIEQFSNNNLQLLIHSNSGYDNFTLKFVKSASYPIIVGNSIRSLAVSQHIISAFCEHFSPIPHHKQWNHERKWDRTLADKIKVLLIGHGHIGSQVYNTLSALSAQITIYDPYKKKNGPFEKLPLEQFNVIILCASLNPTSRSIMSNSIFSRLAKNVLIINTARGALIDQPSLITFLSKNPSAFAYLDVFEQEPFLNNTFISLKNIKTSSHIAGVFNNIDNAILSFEKKVITDFLTYRDFKKRYANQLLQKRIVGDFLI